MRRVLVLVLGALAVVTAGLAVAVLPAAAASSVTLGSSTCSVNGPDVTLNGTWNSGTSTCVAAGFAAVQAGSTLTIPSGTTLTDSSATSPFSNGGSVVNDGTVNACYWNDFGKGVTTNAVSGAFNISALGSCRSSEHELYLGGSFQNHGAYTNAGSLVIDGNLGGSSFTNFCGSTYKETGAVVAVQGGTLVPASGCPQTITFTGPATGLVGGFYTPSASATSGLPVSFSLDPSSSGCALSPPTVTFTGAGTCVVDADQAGNGTYAAAPKVQVSTTISLIPQTITFTGPPTGLAGGFYTPSATATSGLPVSFSLDPSSTGCALSPPTVTFTGAGTCVVDADQAGNGTYATAPTVRVSTTIASLSPQTITFLPLADKVYGSAPFSLTASATSGLSVSFASLTPAVCSVSGTTVALKTTGLCTIEATQAGNGSWTAASPVDQSFKVVAVVKVFAPGDFPVDRGSMILVAFWLVDANGKPIPSTLATTATFDVTFNGGSPVHVLYTSWVHGFLALVPTPRKLAPGRYPLTITSTSTSVPTEPTTVTVKISGDDDRR